MKIYACKDCGHRVFQVLYTPKYCNDCGRRNLKQIPVIDWIVLVVIVFLILKFFI